MASIFSKGLHLAHTATSCATRSYSQAVQLNASSASAAYFIPRNSRGSLPVYSDIRNGGTRYLVLVKNVRGDIHELRNDLASSIFEPGSEQAARVKAEVVRPDTLVISGGRWKHDVMDWLLRKGF